MRMQTLSINPAMPRNHQDLADIYERHSHDLFRYAYHILGDSDLAEDCVAETFSRFLAGLKQGRGPVENVRAYLYRMVQNWITDHFRRHPLPPLNIEDDLPADLAGNPSEVVAQQLEAQQMRAALLRLSSDQRQVIELRFLEGWSHEEIAAAIGKSVEATRALQHRGLESLRQMLLD